MGLRIANVAAGGALTPCRIPHDGWRSMGAWRADAKMREPMPGLAHPTRGMVKARDRAPTG